MVYNTKPHRSEQLHKVFFSTSSEYSNLDFNTTSSEGTVFLAQKVSVLHYLNPCHSNGCNAQHSRAT